MWSRGRPTGGNRYKLAVAENGVKHWGLGAHHGGSGRGSFPAATRVGGLPRSGRTDSGGGGGGWALVTTRPRGGVPAGFGTRDEDRLPRVEAVGANRESSEQRLAADGRGYDDPTGGSRDPRWAPPAGGGELPNTPWGYRVSGMKTETREQAGRRLRKIAGQVAALERMVDEDRYCVDVLLQIAAVRGALDKVGKLLLEGHVETCVTTAIRSGRARDRDEKLGELIEVFSRFAHIGGR